MIPNSPSSSACRSPEATLWILHLQVPFWRIRPGPLELLADEFKVEWDAAKDQALWDVLSRPSKGDDIDCTEYSHVILIALLPMLKLYHRESTVQIPGIMA